MPQGWATAETGQRPAGVFQPLKVANSRSLRPVGLQANAEEQKFE